MQTIRSLFNRMSVFFCWLLPQLRVRLPSHQNQKPPPPFSAPQAKKAARDLLGPMGREDPRVCNFEGRASEGPRPRGPQVPLHREACSHPGAEAPPQRAQVPAGSGGYGRGWGEVLGVGSQIFSTIVLFKNQLFLLGFRRFSRKKNPWKEWGRYP